MSGVTINTTGLNPGEPNDITDVTRELDNIAAAVNDNYDRGGVATPNAGDVSAVDNANRLDAAEAQITAYLTRIIPAVDTTLAITISELGDRHIVSDPTLTSAPVIVTLPDPATFNGSEPGEVWKIQCLSAAGTYMSISDVAWVVGHNPQTVGYPCRPGGAYVITLTDDNHWLVETYNEVVNQAASGAATYDVTAANAGGVVRLTAGAATVTLPSITPFWYGQQVTFINEGGASHVVATDGSDTILTLGGQDTTTSLASTLGVFTVIATSNDTGPGFMWVVTNIQTVGP